MGTATHRVVGSLAASANLSYVPQDHEPVLAEELIDLLDENGCVILGHIGKVR